MQPAVDNRRMKKPTASEDTVGSISAIRLHRVTNVPESNCVVLLYLGIVGLSMKFPGADRI